MQGIQIEEESAIQNSSSGAVIQRQPNDIQVANDGLMSIPQNFLAQNCPSGLQTLLTINNLKVTTNVQYIETLFSYDVSKKYTITNLNGQKIFHAVEDLSYYQRCSRSIRPFELNIFDESQNEIIRLSRPLNCQSCFLNCCMQKIEVYSPPGCLIGVIEENWSILTSNFTIRNAAYEEVLKIKGQICHFRGCGDVEFKILSKDQRTKIGFITKQSSAFFRDGNTSVDFFDVNFPRDLDVHMKAVLLGASFLMNILYFEH